MTPVETALVSPCYLAEETALPQFSHRLQDGRSLVLTLNAGFE